MRYLSLWLPFLSTDRIFRRLRKDERAALKASSGLVTIAKIKNAQRLVAVDPAAAACGLKPGMMLADARAMLPALSCFPSDPEAEAACLTDITDWCRRFTPLAALDPPDGVMLDVTGAAHLFGGEEKLMAEMEERLAAQGFAARCALAPTVEAAFALARFGKGFDKERRAILPDCDEKDIARRLGALPLAALRLQDDVLAALHQAGLRRIDDLLLRPRAPLAARFGSALFARLDGLLGRARQPISPRFEAPAYLVERRFAETILRREDVEATIFALAGELAQLLTLHGEGARTLDLSLFRVDGAVNHIELGLSRAGREPKLIARLFHEKIEALCAQSEDDPLDGGFGFDVLRLSALAVERLDQAQAHWLAEEHESEDLADLIDRLGARLGLRRVTRLALVDTHIPEFAVTAVPASEMCFPREPFKRTTIRSEASPLTGESGPRVSEDRMRGRANLSGLSSTAEILKGDCDPSPGLLRKPPSPARGEGGAALPTRPLRLLPRPEPIETIAGVPDGPPLRFRWRCILHEIAAIEGPERIAPEWWKNEIELTRDYFRAEDLEGQRFWLFREGLYEAATARADPDQLELHTIPSEFALHQRVRACPLSEKSVDFSGTCSRPRWFMHGLFA